jgi:sugar lactone lactonase YvrE
VSCTASSACTAVGHAYDTVTERYLPIADRWNGSSWSTQTVPVPEGTVEAELRGVSCPKTTECIAVGYIESEAGVWEDFSERWSGGSWSILSTPGGTEPGYFGELVDVSCSSTTFCIGVGWHNTGGGSQPNIVSWNGTKWTTQTPASGAPILWGVSCTSSTFCIAVDYFGGIQNWNGTSWTKSTTATLSDVTGPGWENVSCSSSTNCAATGVGWSKLDGQATTLVENWNGSSWSEQTTPRESEYSENGLAGISCWDRPYCVAVGYSRASGPLKAIAEVRRDYEVTPSYSTSIGAEGSGKGQLKYPEGMAVDSAGNLYVADTENNRVEKFNAKGEFQLEFGKKGTGNGEFIRPAGVAIDPQGNLWVTDAGNDRVQEFTPEGKYLFQFGSSGTEYGKFTEPWGIAIEPNGNIWVSDISFYRVEEFTSKGEYIGAARGAPEGGEGPEIGPRGIALDGEGHLYVCDAPHARVMEYSTTPKGSYFPFLGEFGSEGTGDGQFEESLGIAVKANGDILVSDRRGRVEEFSPSGEFETKFGVEGTGSGQFREPQDIAVGVGGRAYVVDRINSRVQRWQQPAAPEVSTQAASGVTASVATIAGSVNPGGISTGYHFQYTTAADYELNGYTNAISSPSPDGSVGSGIDPVSESKELTGLEGGTTYHFRLVGSNNNGTVFGEDKTLKTEASTAERLSAMAVTDPFNGTTSAVSNFGTNWSALGWAAGTTPKGENTSTGWRPAAAYPTVNGAYFSPTVTDAGAGVAAEATMATNPGNTSRYFSIWLDQSTAGSTRSGYELKFTNTATNTYSVALSKWVSGTQTALGSQSSVTFNNGNSFAVVDQGSTVSAWANTGAGFSQLLSASDSTFSGGTAAVEGSGNITRLTNFKVGQLLASVSNMDAALKTLQLNDSFGTNENPLSEGGAWAALSWDTSGSGHNTGQVSGGWGPYDSYSTVNGAYWTKTTFADTGAGDAVAATLTTSPANTSRYFALWLNASSPGSVKSGYEERFTETSTGVYEVVLSKLSSGTKTVLATKTGYSFPVKSQFGLIDKGGTVSAWTSTGAEYTQLLSASDSTFTSGYTGVEGSGNVTRLTNFRSGPLAPF